MHHLTRTKPREREREKIRKEMSKLEETMESDEQVMNPTVSRWLALYQQYFNKKMAVDCPIGRHIDQMSDLAAELEAAGVEVSESMKVMTIMASLPQSLKDAVLSDGLLSKKDLTITDMKKRLSSVADLRGLNKRLKSEETKESEEQVVTPWEVTAEEGGKIDYKKLVEKFGLQLINKSLIDRVQRLTNRPPHVFLRRGVFFAHRDFHKVLDAYERNQKFYLYTGRGPSSEALHLGHLIPFMFTKYLQEAFKVPVVIQLTDDEKCMWKNLSVEESMRLARENAKDIIACGFDISRTFIFQNLSGFSGGFYQNIVEINKQVARDEVVGIFGFSDEDNIGKSSFPPIQAAPSFPTSFPHLFSLEDNPRCLIPCAIDQDPYFRMTRDVAPRLGYHKPALIESLFLPALQGEAGKMSDSDPISAIYLTDSTKKIKNKVNRYAFSGGQDSVENQRKYGANLEVDIPVKYFNFFLEDDAELEHIKKEYGAGKMLTGEVKNRLVEVLSETVERHQRARAAVTDEMVDTFMALRPLPDMFK